VLYAPTQSLDQVQCLHYGDARVPLARIIPDKIYPSMWRVVLADGRRSDPVSRTRAKDLAAVIAERGPPRRDPRLLRWKQEAHVSLSGARRRARAPDPSLTTGNGSEVRPRTSRGECDTCVAWRVVAGPDVPDPNLRFPLDPELANRQERTRVAVEEHLRKAKRAAARKLRLKPVPVLDLDPPPPALHSITPIPSGGDPFEMPAFLDRCRFVELDLEEAA
jgi:hypothetical protein